MEQESEIKALMSLAYDPSRTSVEFDGQRITGFSSGKKYARLSRDTHELYLQVTSQFLQKFGVGSKGLLTIVAHAGEDKTVGFCCGDFRIVEIYIEELSCDVPQVIVVLKNENNLLTH